MITLQVKEHLNIKTVYTATICDFTKAIAEYYTLLNFLKKPLPKGKNGRERHRMMYQHLKDAYHKAAAVRVEKYVNLAPTAGRAVIAQRLSNITTYTGILNYAALGDDTTVPTNGDTTLGNETYRQTITSQNAVNNLSYQSVFIPAGTATGTHKEAGLFIDGAAGADTGQLFSHVNIDITKSAQNSLTLDIEITLA